MMSVNGNLVAGKEVRGTQPGDNIEVVVVVGG